MAKTESTYPYDSIAERAMFLASKVVTKEGGFDDLAHNSQVIRELELDRGCKMGAGTTAKHLKGFVENTAFGPGMIITNDHLSLHHGGLEATGGWKEHYRHYGTKTKYGHLILAGTLEHFRKWAKSGACVGECAKVKSGRLFAFIDGYIVHVDAENDCASASVRDGKGFIVYSNGNYYLGDIKGGKKNGDGKFTFVSGASYTGQLVDGDFHGKGTWDYDDGARYVGDWIHDKKHGKGTMTWASGNRYVGDWSGGEKHGSGTLYYSGGDSYVGQWQNGAKKGEGTYTWKDGSKYVGQWQDNDMHGRGKKYDTSGKLTFDGNWIHDKAQK